MSKFIGGSAFSMARDIGEGFVNVTERTFKGMTDADMNKLAFEIDRFLRELRGTQVLKGYYGNERKNGWRAQSVRRYRCRAVIKHFGV